MGQVFGRWQLNAAGQTLRTNCYIVVPKDQRGTVDTPATTADLVGNLTISRKLGQQGRVFMRPSSFGESRQNGTGLQRNDSRICALPLASFYTLDAEVSRRLLPNVKIFAAGQNLTSVRYLTGRTLGASSALPCGITDCFPVTVWLPAADYCPHDEPGSKLLRGA